MLHTRICDLFGIELPISNAGMGGVALAPLAAAVSEAGGIGTVRARGFLTRRDACPDFRGAHADQETAGSEFAASCATVLSSSWRMNPSMR
jgi:NAD(P)H-dependent flavin oxidoreductase YrpB (nitropropane dioxygenase family)